METVSLPGVVSVTPAQGATSVAVNATISATFSEAMSATTVNASTFTLTAPGGVAVPGTVTYSGLMATFTPSGGPLAVSTTYTATLTNGITSQGGAPLVGNYAWSFTMVIPSVPAVVAVTPPQGATNVGLSAVVSATFNMAMNPSTLNGSTFTLLAPGNVAVSGTVTVDPTDTFATFTPTGGMLAYGTTYTATITTGAMSAGSIPLGGNYIWTFSTQAATVPQIAAVTPIPGAANVSVSAAISATFSLPMTVSSLNGATFLLHAPGNIAVSGMVGVDPTHKIAMFTPTGGTLAYGTTYTAMITTGATSAGSIPLAANYTWTFTTISANTPVVLSVTPLPGATNVGLSAAISATFSLPMSTGSLNGATFTLASPGNVAVSGMVGVDPTHKIATFTPTGVPLAYSTTYTATITTGATSAGNIPLVADYVWTFTTMTPPPMVVATVPVNNATGVPVVQVVRARFNEAVTCSTLVTPATNFTITGPGLTPVAGTVGCSGNQATFTPNIDLSVNTVYIATISTGVTDLTGTPMVAAYTWTFSTVPALPPAPTVISTVPANLAVGVPVNQALTATFSEAMDGATVNSASFLLKVTGGASVNGAITYAANGSVATFVPDVALLYSTNYTATITNGAFNLDDSERVTSYSWTFTTAATPLLIPPTVISTNPVTSPEDTDVPLNQVVSAVFSTPMNPNTINSTTFNLKGPGNTLVGGLVAYAAIGNQLVFMPTTNLTAGTTYTATITTGVQDLAAVSLANQYSWTFMTGTTPVIIAPELTLAVPANLATGVALNAAVSGTFSKAMNPLTLTPATFQLTTGGILADGGTLIPATITYDAVNSIATLTPTNLLTASTTYTVLVTDGATDLAGNPLGSTGVTNPWTFTTGAMVVPPPLVLGPTISLFGGFGGPAGMTNSGDLTVINGDIGTTGVSTTMTGFYDESVPAVAAVYPCSYTAGAGADYGLVNGTIETAPVPPSPGCPNEGTGPSTQPGMTFYIATQAAAEALTAYTTLQGLPSGATLSTNELGNRVLAPGTYTSATFYQITTGPLTLNAQGNPNAYWIFQIGSYLKVGTPGTPQAASESVVLENGALASHVFWAVGSAATINPAGGGTFVGTVLSQAGISVSTAGNATVAVIDGRLIALHASTTLVNTVINVPTP